MLRFIIRFKSILQKNRLMLSAVLLINSPVLAQNIRNNDWLVTPVKEKARIYTDINDQEIILDNGLVRRAFRLQPNMACIDYLNLSNGQQLLRAIKPEGSVVIDGEKYNIGGLYGQTENAY